MLSRLGHLRITTPRQRVGLATTVSLALHLLAVTALLALVHRTERSPAPELDVPAIVEVSTQALDDPGVPAAPATTGAPRAAPPAPALHRPRPRRVAAEAPRPAVAATPAPAPSSAPPSAVPPPPAPAPLAIDVGGTPPAAGEPAGGHSRLALFRADLREHLRQAWRAREVYQRVDPEGRLHGSLFKTSVQLRLRADGGIVTAEVSESSGGRELDAATL